VDLVLDGWLVGGERRRREEEREGLYDTSAQSEVERGDLVLDRLSSWREGR
jgi:hypothetical protein